jgi:hypothetical protein
MGSTLTSDPIGTTFDKVIPFKFQMNLNIPNLEGNIDVEVVIIGYNNFDAKFLKKYFRG